MRATDPHFLLFSKALGDSVRAPHWRFVLQPVGSDAIMAVADTETGAPASRLELLAVVRGLEALDQPSHVTLLTASRYVLRGIRRGLPQWRERRWRWERFGQLVPIRDYDLWQRVDRALEFHQVECCEWRGDELVARPAAELCPDSDSPAAACDEVSRTKTAMPAPVAPQFCLAEEPALVIVPRVAGRRLSPRRTKFLPGGKAIESLWHGIWSQFAAFCRPSFTRAA